MVASLEVLLLEKVERRREEMVDLHLVDWIMEGICGLGSVSSMMGWCWLWWWLNWFLGLLHLMRSATVVVVVSVPTRMVQREREERDGNRCE